MTTWLLCALSYLLGGIPFALVVVRLLKGVDVRTIGSGNVGATNASRAFTGKARVAVFALIYVLDFAKGFVPAYGFPRWFDTSGLGVAAPVVLGACAILGHVLTPFLNFKGGKGVATSCGVIAALDGVALIVGLAVFGLVFAATKRVFVGSLALGLTLPIVVVARAPESAFQGRLPITVFCLAIAALLFWTHRSNIKKALGAARAGGVA